MKGALALRKPVATKVTAYTTSPVVVGAWLEVWSALPYACSGIEIFDSSGNAMKLGLGSAGNEVALPYTLPPGGETMVVPMEIGVGKRLSVSPLVANSTSGLLIVNLYQ